MQGGHQSTADEQSERLGNSMSFPPLPPTVSDLGPVISVASTRPPVVHTEETIIPEQPVATSTQQSPIVSSTIFTPNRTPPSESIETPSAPVNPADVQSDAPDPEYSAPSTDNRGHGDLPTPPHSPPSQREVRLPITPHLFPKVERAQSEIWEMDWRKPTITELVPPSGLSIQEMNGGPDPNIPKVWDIQVHLLEEYEQEAKRMALEEDVYRREVELEMMREKERIVPGLDNTDLNALVRTFDKVSEQFFSKPGL